MYQYQATVLRVVDGDTVDLDFDLGLRVHSTQRVRLFGINAPERYTEAGRVAFAALCAMLPVGKVVTVDTHKDKTEKYGRWLADITVPATQDSPPIAISPTMVQHGWAVYWDGKGEKP